MKQNKPALPQKHPLEWFVFGASLALVLFVIGYLAYSAFTQRETLPNLEIELGQPVLQRPNEPDLYSVPVTVRNRGGQTALEVSIEVSLYAGDELLETAQMTLPMVPYRSERRGMVLFIEDPAQGRLVARVLGFVYP